MSSVDWCKLYERLGIRFEEKLARLSSKTNNIHDTKKWSFPLRIYLMNLSKSAVLCEYVHIYYINSEWKSSFFVHWFVQVNRQKTTVKKEITYFFKNYVASLFLKKSLQSAIFFTTWCLDVRFWDLLYFICLKFNPQYWYLLLRREKMCWFSSYF